MGELLETISEFVEQIAQGSCRVIKRSFGWFGKLRQLRNDYELRLNHSKILARIRMIRPIVKRPAETPHTFQPSNRHKQDFSQYTLTIFRFG
jgi:hypothetical protein